MKLSQGVEWGLHCCVVLGQAIAPVPTARLAEFHGVSQTYLAKHLQALARAGLVRSTQGQVGGYELVRPAADITLLDVDATAILNALYRGEEVPAGDLERLVLLFRLGFRDPAEALPELAGRPVYLGLACRPDRSLRMKPQNLLSNLPLAAPDRAGE